LSAERLTAHLDADPSLGEAVNKYLAIRQMKYLTQVIALGTLSARERLEELLRKFTVNGSQGLQAQLRIHVPVKHLDLARLIAVTPSYLSRMLSDLEKEESFTANCAFIYGSRRAITRHC